MACMVNSTGVMPAGKGRRASEPSESRLLGIVKDPDGIRVFRIWMASESGWHQNPQNPDRVRTLRTLRIWIASESGSRQNLDRVRIWRQNLDRVRIWIASESGSRQNLDHIRTLRVWIAPMVNNNSAGVIMPTRRGA
eukprot:7827441-Pyramimonas_sp.AAC.2